MTEGWLDKSVTAKLFTLKTIKGQVGSIDITANQENTQIRIGLTVFFKIVYLDTVWFPLSWLHVCIAVETVTGRVALAVNGESMEAISKAAKVPYDFTEDEGFRIELGHTYRSATIREEHEGMVSNINIFGSALSTKRMIAITGGEECGAPGDYVSWKEAQWTLHSKARLVFVDVLEDFFPCKKESKVTTYSAPFKTASSCMNHCGKIGGGRSPSIQTQEEWEWMYEQYKDITPNTMANPNTWLAATDEAKEAVWE